MLNPEPHRRGDEHPLQGLSVLAGMMLQAAGGELAAERVSVWWEQHDHVQGLASLGRAGVTPMHAKLREPGRLSRHWYPDARVGALAGLPACLQVPLRIDDHRVGLLVLERRRADASSPVARDRLRSFARQLAHALYRYDRESTLTQCFRDREGVAFTGRSGLVERIAAYWANARLTVSPRGFVEDADAGALECFGASSVEDLRGEAVSRLFSGVPWIVYHENRHPPRPQRCTGHRVDGTTFYGILTVLSRSGAEAPLEVLLRTVGHLGQPVDADPGPALWTPDTTSALPGRDVAHAGMAGARAQFGGGWVVARIEIDHFMALHVSHGAPVANAVLEHAHTVLDSLLRPGDFVSHWSGAAFAVGLIGADEAMAEAALEQLGAAVAQFPAPTPAGRIPVTVSSRWCIDDGVSSADRMMGSLTREAAADHGSAIDSP